MVLLINLMILFTAAFVLGDLNLKLQNHNIDPLVIDSSKERNKRTIFENLLTHNNYALARHFVYRNGVKYLLGYGQVDLKYMPHFKPVIVRPRFSIIPWHSPLNPSLVTNNDAWKPVVPPKSDNALQIHQPTQFEPIKLNVPVLPFGAMFLTTPIMPPRQQQLEYYPLPVQTAVYMQNPHPHHVVAPVQPDQNIHQVPGGSYELHGYHQPPYETHQEQESPPEEDHHYDEQPYVGSLEFHGSQQREHVIQPGQTDVQIPLHLVQHPNYRPEDYYNYPAHYNGHIAAERSSGVIQNGAGKAPFKPSQKIVNYKHL